MSDDDIIKYATGYVKGRLSIVTLEQQSKYMWWVRIESSNPFKYHCDLYTFERFAIHKFWKLVELYGLKVTEFEPFKINKEKILEGLILKKPCS